MKRTKKSKAYYKTRKKLHLRSRMALKRFINRPYRTDRPTLVWFDGYQFGTKVLTEEQIKDFLNTIYSINLRS